MVAKGCSALIPGQERPWHLVCSSASPSSSKFIRRGPAQLLPTDILVSLPWESNSAQRKMIKMI